MMRLKRLAFTAVSAIGLMACGGSKTTNAIQDNAPTFSSVAMDMTDSDANAPSGETAALVPGPDGTCHPYLFARTRNVVHRLNVHLYKTLFMMDHVIKEHPNATSGSTATWTRSGAKYTLQVVGTKVSDTEFSYDISVKANSDPDSAYQKVTTADVKLTGAAGSKDESGTLHYDFSAFASVIKEAKVAGTLDYTFDVSGQKKNIEVKLADFTPDDDLPDLSPRNAHYVFVREKGVGGSIKYTDELILACPKVGGVANTTERSSVDTVFRWTHLSDGTLIGRGDTEASAEDSTGNIPQGDKIVGVTCGTFGATDTEKYWMMKLEDSTGATVVSGTFSFDSAPNTDPTTACDAAFGAVPGTDSNANDFNFGTVNFDDSTTVAYPSQG